MADVYDRLSQLIPGSLFLTYKTIEPIILGTTTCSHPQMVLLWLLVVAFSILCFGSSLIADFEVQYIPLVMTWLDRFPILKIIAPPVLIHTLLATASFLVIILFNPPTFACLFGDNPNSIIVQVIPIMAGTVLLTSYGIVFKFP